MKNLNTFCLTPVFLAKNYFLLTLNEKNIFNMSDSYYDYDFECMPDVPDLNCSPISDQIMKKWLMLHEKNVFNYKLMIDKDKVLPGQYTFYIQVS